MALRGGKRGVVLIATSAALFAQPINPNQLQQIIAQIIKYRDEFIRFLMTHQVQLFMLFASIPMLLFMYFDAKLFFRLLRDITVLITRRKQLLPIEKKWYMWRISLKVVGIVILSALIIVNAGAVAWMSQFKSLGEMFAALDKMRRQENPLKFLEAFLGALRRR